MTQKITQHFFHRAIVRHTFCCKICDYIVVRNYFHILSENDRRENLTARDNALQEIYRNVDRQHSKRICKLFA